MKNKKGFTLVELIGVFLILTIVLGIASIAYININNHIRKVYYTGVEQTLLQAGGEYFSYNKGNSPKIFGSQTIVPLRTLLVDEYVSGIVDIKGNTCQLDNSYVGAYRNSLDKIDYYVCLECGDYFYENDSEVCSGDIDYTLRMTATIRNTKEIYSENSYVRGYVTLTFKTANDIERIEVKDQSDEIVKTCTLSGNDVKSCNITIDSSGKYKSYGVGANGSTTASEEIEIKVDNVAPQFNLLDSNNNNIAGTTINLEVSDNTINVVDRVVGIVDSLSGVNSIRYSFNRKNEFETYNEIDVDSTEFEINKNLDFGEYKLVVEIEDNVENKNRQVVNYKVSKQISIPTTSNCNNVTYTGTNQILTNETEGIIYKNNSQINVGSYIVKATLKDNYIWSDGSITEKQFNCSINKANMVVTKTDYNGEFDGNNHTFTLTTTPSNNVTIYYSTSTPLTTSNYTSGTTTKPTRTNPGITSVYYYLHDTSGNYNDYASNENNNNATIKIINNTSNFTVTLEETNYVYDGNAKTPSVTVKDGNTILVKDIDYTVSYSNNINAGTATVVITAKGKYTGEKIETFTINKANGYIQLDKNASDITSGTTSITFNVSSSHGGELSVSTNNSITYNISGTVVTLSNIPIINSDPIVVTVTSGQTQNYNAASTNYTLRILPKENNVEVVSNANSNVSYVIPPVNSNGVIINGKEPTYRNGVNNPSWKTSKQTCMKNVQGCNKGARSQQAFVRFKFNETDATSLNYWLSDNDNCSNIITSSNGTKNIPKTAETMDINLTTEGNGIYFCWQLSNPTTTYAIDKIGPLYIDGTAPFIADPDYFNKAEGKFKISSPSDNLSGADGFYVVQRSSGGNDLGGNWEFTKNYFRLNKEVYINCFGEDAPHIMRHVYYSIFDKAGNAASWTYMGKISDSVSQHPGCYK